MKTIERAITSKEKITARKSNLFIIPLSILFFGIVYLILKLDFLPPVFKWITFGIIGLTFIIFISKLILLEIELFKGKITETKGFITDKKIYLQNTGFQKKNVTKKRADPIYKLIIDGNEFTINKKHYKKAIINKDATLIYLPKSKFFINLLQN